MSEEVITTTTTTTTTTEEEEVEEQIIHEDQDQIVTLKVSEGKRVKWPPRDDEMVATVTVSSNHTSKMPPAAAAAAAAAGQEDGLAQEAQEAQEDELPPPPPQATLEQGEQQQSSSSESHQIKATKMIKFQSDSAYHSNGTSATNGNTVLGKEIFRPTKMSSANRWNPVDTFQQQQQGSSTSLTKPKTKLRDLGDIMNLAETKHSSYHVPPGTSRTRKAQEMYKKHLDLVERHEKV